MKEELYTGYYFYKENYYCVFGTIMVKNEITREWEEFVHYSQMNPDSQSPFCARKMCSFLELFGYVKNMSYKEVEKFYINKSEGSNDK